MLPVTDISSTGSTIAELQTLEAFAPLENDLLETSLEGQVVETFSYSYICCPSLPIPSLLFPEEVN